MKATEHGRRRWHAALAVCVLAVWGIAPPGLSAQCAMCRQALDSPEGHQMIAALRSGVLVLLAAPAALFGTVAALAVRAQRRRGRWQEPPADSRTAAPRS